MKKYFLITFLFCITINTSAQLVIDSSAVDLDDRVNALVIYGNNKYLNTENGLIFLTGKDPYEEYYRMIYSDSTITNPNTVIEPNGSANSMFYFIPPIDVKEWADNYIDITDQIYLKDVYLLNNGAVVINPDIEKYLNKLESKKKNNSAK